MDVSGIRDFTRRGRRSAPFARRCRFCRARRVLYNPRSSRACRLSMPLHRPFHALIASVFAALLVSFATTIARADTGAPVLLVVGDSISAGYGLTKGTGWVDLLAARIDAQHLPWRVVNASITGDTTAGGRARLPALLAQHKPAVVDRRAGRQRRTARRQSALDEGQPRCDDRDGPQGGREAARDRHEASAQLRPGVHARIRGAVRRCREGERRGARARSSSRASPNPTNGSSSDRIHPTAAAQPKLLDNVWPVLSPLLAKPR